MTKLEYLGDSAEQQLTEARTRVLAGVAFLDDHPLVAEGWRERIDPDTFHIGNHNHCVLPQVTGLYSYSQARAHLFPEDTPSFTIKAYGFDWGSTEHGIWIDSEPLNEAWYEYLWPVTVDGGEGES